VSGKTVAVVGGGPAGLSCAHRLAMLGHQVTIYNRDTKPGGLNEYGIAAYKTVDDFAQREVRYILSIGNIDVENGVALGVHFTLADLREKHDAVFLGIGLGAVNALGLDDEGVPGVEDAVDYIAKLRQAGDKSTLPVGRRVVVVGGGMTAIDIAVQSKCLGAEDVVIVYRRGADQMGASEFEQNLAQTSGVTILHWAAPVALNRIAGGGITLQMEKTQLDADGKLRTTGESFALEADVIFKAIGQTLADESLGKEQGGLQIVNGKIIVDADQATSIDGIWAGGDCVAGGDDLTVSAVQHGKIAAIAIDRSLRNG
ncbi:MAG: FAD-dependent oxidoreductase, partial [Gammaproteobacteria bacterium]|nr:FAD-dependent oxidoreductase [Gammaproteobacteria bacterium]